MEASPSTQDWTADFWPLTTGISTDSFSNIMASPSSSSSSQPPRTPGTGLTLGRLDLVGQQQKVVPSSSSMTSDSNSAATMMATPQPSPSPNDSKRRGSDTARKDRSNVLKAYLMDVGCTKIRGARKRRKNEDGEYEGGKIDWDSEWVQEQLIIQLEEFKAIRLDYERRSKEKKLTDATIERDWVTKDGVRIPKAKMLKNYYPTNLVLHRFFDLMHGNLLANHRVSPHIEELMQNINPFLKTRPLALYKLPSEETQGHVQGLTIYRGAISRTDPLVVMYTCDGKEHLEVDGRFFFHEQRCVLAQPTLKACNYLDDVLIKGVARRLRPEVELLALWQSAFGKGQQMGGGGGGGEESIMGWPREVEVELFLSCFTEAFRPTLRYLFLAPYENKTMVGVEEFQAFFVWAAGLSEGGLSVQEQLKALVAELQGKVHAHTATHTPTAREDVVLYLTTSKAKPLTKPGDYYLRVSNTQAGWFALEYVPPVGGSVSGAGGVVAAAGGEGGEGGSGAVSAVQPQASLFYFHVTVDSEESRVYFTDRSETHPNIVSLILKHTGVDSWGRLRQRCVVKALPVPPLPPAPTTTTTTTTTSTAVVSTLKDMMVPLGMFATPFGLMSQPSPGKISSAAAVCVKKEGGGGVSLMTVDGAGMLASPPPAHAHTPTHTRMSSRRQGSLDSLGLMPGLSNLDLPHSFGVGPSWRSTDHHLDVLLQEHTHTHTDAMTHEADQLLPQSPQQQQQQPQQQQQQQQQAAGAHTHTHDALSLGILPTLQVSLPHHPPQEDHHQQNPTHPHTHTHNPHHQQYHPQQQTHTHTHNQPTQPLPAQLHLADTNTHTHTHTRAPSLDMGPPFHFPRSAAASSDRLHQLGGVGVGGSVSVLDDPFPLQDFLVSSTSSFGSLGLSSLAASTPGQTLTGSSSGGQNRFFVDQIVNGVDHMHMHMHNGGGIPAQAQTHIHTHTRNNQSLGATMVGSWSGEEGSGSQDMSTSNRSKRHRGMDGKPSP